MSVDSEERPTDLAAWVRPRARILAGAAAAGVVAGVLGSLGLGLYTGDATFGASQVFAVGTLLLGFGLLGWSGSVFAGRGIENMQEYMDTGSEWTERDSRRAMARITGFGLGVMLGAPLAAAVVP